MSKNKKQLIFLHLIFTVAFALYMTVTTIIFHASCPMRILFDAHCPFCGMTRAWISFMRLDTVGAFRHHPLFIFAPVYLFFIFHDDLSKAKKPRMPFIVFFTALLILIFILRISPANIDFFYPL